MRRLLLSCVLVIGCGPVIGSDFVPPPAVPVGQQTSVKVPSAPPPLKAEAAPTCAEDQPVPVPGHWAWDKAWRWVPGHCIQTKDGYIYIWATYADGVFTSDYWSPSGYKEPRAPTSQVPPAETPTNASSTPVAPPQKHKRRHKGKSDISGPVQMDQGSRTTDSSPSAADDLGSLENSE